MSVVTGRLMKGGGVEVTMLLRCTVGPLTSSRNSDYLLDNQQSQKRYMVSGSVCPLISFLDVSFSVSFVVRG